MAPASRAPWLGAACAALLLPQQPLVVAERRPNCGQSGLAPGASCDHGASGPGPWVQPGPPEGVVHLVGRAVSGVVTPHGTLLRDKPRRMTGHGIVHNRSGALLQAWNAGSHGGGISGHFTPRGGIAISQQTLPELELRPPSIVSAAAAKFWQQAVLVYAAVAGCSLALVLLCCTHEAFHSDEKASVNTGSDNSVDELKETSEEVTAGLLGNFTSRRLEQRWLEESHDANISMGARVLCGVSSGYIAYRCIRLAKRSTPGTCLPVNWQVAGTDLACLGLAVAASAWCSRRPNSILYWCLLMFFFFYILAGTLTPFQFSCTDLVEKCAHSNDPYITEASRHADCTLEGYTAQQTIMTWIFMLPWVMPRLRLMALAWIWLYAVYFSWSAIYRHYMHVAAKTFSGTDVVFHFVVLNVTLALATREKSLLENMQRLTFVSELRLRAASRKLFQILKYMVPAHVVVPMVQKPGKVIAEQVNRATVLFVIIDDFDRIADRLTPAEVLAFLNEQFTKFDQICEANRVTKIETVGEEYVCCVGVMPEDVRECEAAGHSQVLRRLMVAVEQMLRLQNEAVQFKMGMHTGPIVAGVLGQRLPRYRLFGDTINTAARMMQKGEVGRLQFGEETHNDMPDDAPLDVELRGEIELKGKGNVKAYLSNTSEDPESEAQHPSHPGTLRPKRESIFGSVLGPAEPREHPEADQVYSCKVPSSSLTKKLTTTLTKKLTNQEGKQQPEESQLLLLVSDPEFEQVLKDTLQDGSLDNESLEGWSRWHHGQKVCKKLTLNLDLQLLVLIILTVLEAMYMTQYQDLAKTNRGVPGNVRLPLFLFCRAVVLTILVAWRIIASSSSGWFHEHPSKVLVGRLLSWCIIAVVLFISYDDLTPDERAVVQKGRALVEIAPFSQNFSLVFVLVYTLITRVKGLLFYPSLVFIFLAVTLMANAWYVENENIVASIPAKVFFIVNALLSSAIAYADEQTSRVQYKAKISMEATTSRVQGILNTLMPPLVLEELRTLPPGAPQPTHSYERATICQSDLCGFTRLSATCSPQQVVAFMGDLFGLFDKLTDKYGVYKVETVGDAYIAGTAEAPLTPTNSPVSVVLFSLAMVDAVRDWAARLGEAVSCRVGVHHGECIGGVVGTGMQRYHLFGKLLSGIEILESTAPEGQVQVSAACKVAVERQASLEGQQLEFRQREDPHLTTSKGLVRHYEDVGGRTLIASFKS